MTKLERENHKIANEGVNDSAEFFLLSEEFQTAILQWIKLTIQPAKREHRMSSYGLKHELQAQTGVYLTNGEFKGAMVAAGYEPTNPEEINWTFRIKPASKLKKKRMELTYVGEIFPLGLSEETRKVVERLQKASQGQKWVKWERSPK